MREVFAVRGLPMKKTLCVVLVLLATALSGISAAPDPMALGVDVDFYTGPIAREVWLQMKNEGQAFAIVQAWGGRSRNEFAVSQLADARTIGGMKTAAYILLNYDNKVCPTFAAPVRDRSGRCTGQLIAQKQAGARWQVQQGLAALGSELAHVAFVAIDVEWFLSTPPSMDPKAVESRRKAVLDAIDEIRAQHKKVVIYTRNARRHWLEITGCDMAAAAPGCADLYSVIADPSNPVPLWDVQNGDASLADFQPHGAWADRAGRQYKLDANLFGLPPGRTIDLNVFDPALFEVSLE
jgi:hypothetical protein